MSNEFQLRRLIFAPYLHNDELATLKNYKYVAAMGTPLDAFYDAWIWTPASKLIPRNIHPNTLTVAALTCSFVLAYFPLSYYSPDFATGAPGWVYLLSAISYFAYEVLDAIDGKQARRLKLSNPVGQMMDHGCDSLTTFYSAFLAASVARVGSTWFVTALTGAASLQLLLYCWYEYAFHQFKCSTGPYCGVSEAHLLIISMNLLAFLNPNFWILNIYDLIPNCLIFWRSSLIASLTAGRLLSLLGIFGVITSVVKDYREIQDKLKKREKLPAKCIRNGEVVSNESSFNEWVHMMIHWAAGVMIMYYGGLMAHPWAITTIVAFSGSQFVLIILISTVGRTPLRLASKSLLPYYATAVACVMNIMKTESSQKFMLWAAAVWAFLSFMRFVIANILAIRAYLKIDMFTVRSSTTNNN